VARKRLTRPNVNKAESRDSGAGICRLLNY
jgi:hypothetical protein